MYPKNSNARAVLPVKKAVRAMGKKERACKNTAGTINFFLEPSLSTKSAVFNWDRDTKSLGKEFSTPICMLLDPRATAKGLIKLSIIPRAIPAGAPSKKANLRLSFTFFFSTVKESIIKK
ncbi:MAG TPA: hypothetical protein ACFYEM_06395 [Candidatus Hypogeohydataceae bacterium YC40]